MRMSERNIRLAYVLAACKNSWFWLGIWVFFYLKFTNYGGIGIAETVLIVTGTLAEIPTGAIADLLGKRKTLMVAFLLETVGCLMMAFAGSFPILLLSICVMCVGGAFYSGTLDALVFDSLKQDGQEKNYDKKIANVNTMSLLSPAICSVVGGFMYSIDVRWPFFANAIGYGIGLVAAWFLVEPRIDSVKFNWSNFVKQTGYGLKELFKTDSIKQQTVWLVGIGSIVVITSEMVNSFLGVELKLNAYQLGMLWSIIFLVSAGASQATPFLHRKFGGDRAVTLIGIVIGLTLAISPMAGMITGAVLLIVRSACEGIFGNLVSISINNATESKYRATTISTFNMIKNLPYVVLACGIGAVADKISATKLAVILGAALMVIILSRITVKKSR
jgi:MFS family permease